MIVKVKGADKARVRTSARSGGGGTRTRINLNVDPVLLRRFKVWCCNGGVTMTDVLTTWIEEFTPIPVVAKGGVDMVEHSKRKSRKGRDAAAGE